MKIQLDLRSQQFRLIASLEAGQAGSPRSRRTPFLLTDLFFKDHKQTAIQIKTVRTIDAETRT
jgi:hypothetical protein